MAVSPATRALLARSASLAAYYAGKHPRAANRVAGTVPGATPQTAARSFDLATYYGTPGVVPGSTMPAGWTPPHVTPPGTTTPGRTPQTLGLPPEQQAALIAAAGLNPQIDELKRQAAMKELSGQASVEAAQRVAAALGALGANIPATTQAAYNTAGQNVMDAATMLGGPDNPIAAAAQASAAADNERLAALGLPQTIGTQAPTALQGSQYIGGFLPSQSFYQQAASAVADSLAQQHAGEAGLLQQGLTTQGQRAQEAADLLGQVGSLEATRPGLTQQALATIQDQILRNRTLAEDIRHNKASEAVQSAASKAQIASLNRAWYQTQLQNAKTLTDMTGNLYVVNSKGQVVPAGVKAPGSAAGRSATTAQTAANRIAYQKSQDKIQNAIAWARINISSDQAATAAKREAAYESYLTWRKKHPNAKGTGPGGISSADVRQYQQTAFRLAGALFYGVANKDPKTGLPITTGKNRWQTKPDSAANALRLILMAGVPYTIAYQAIYQLAKLQNSRWIDALAWQKKYKGQGGEAPGHGPGG